MHKHSYQHIPVLNYTGNTALILLPEIFGINESMTSLAERLSKTLHIPVFILDFFFPLKNATTILGYGNEECEQGKALMNSLTGDTFIEQFSQLGKEIQSIYPTCTSLSTMGFCFGGKLAYLTGVVPTVHHIISFYGARAPLPFYNEQSVIEALVQKRHEDTSLRILSIFGEQDRSIPEQDRDYIFEQFEKHGVHHTELLYEAGHGFFNKFRDTYVEDAAQKAWRDMLLWMNGE